LPDERSHIHVRDRLDRREIVILMGVRLARTPDVAPIAAAAGFDGLFVDLQHSTMPLDAAASICMAGRAQGLATLVRVPGPGANVAGQLLDSGAAGLVCPQVASRAEAEAFVSECRYPPDGHRSVAGLNAEHSYELKPLADSISASNRSLRVVMIETPEGVEAAADIAASDGVDSLLVGANDLSAELGVPGAVDHRTVRQSIEAVARACDEHQKVLGVGGVSSQPDLIKEVVGLGARLLIGGFDVGYLANTARADHRIIRDAAGR